MQLKVKFFSLLGNAFAVNDKGITVTCNALFPKDLNIKTGLARYFINRSVLDSSSLENAIARATVQPCANGFSMNIGSVQDSRLLNIELSPYYTFAISEVVSNASHVNTYKHLNVPQIYDISSMHRQIRIDQFSAWSNIQDMLTILGDQNDIHYPIFRDGTYPDTNVSTIATAVFDLNNKLLQIYQANPSNSKPVISSSLVLF